MAIAKPAASARPLPEYAALVGIFGSALGAFLVLGRTGSRSGSASATWRGWA